MFSLGREIGMMRKVVFGLVVLVVVFFGWGSGVSFASTVYWTDLLSDQVYTYNTETSTIDTMSTSNPRYLGVDPSTGQPYWGTHDPRGIVTMPDGQPPQTLLSTNANSNDISIDPGTGHLYWTEVDVIKRADLDGTNQITILSGLGNVIGLDLDLPNGQMYFTSYNEGSIFRANLDGTALSAIVSGGSSILDVFIDQSQSHLYWTQEDTCGVGGIFRSNLDGSSQTQLSTGACNPRSVAVDSVDSKLYWTTSSGAYRSNLDGTGSETLATGLSFGLGLDIYSPIPEPSTALLLGIGLSALAATRRRAS